MSCLFLFLSEARTYAHAQPGPARDVLISFVPVEAVVNLRDFGASGDGVADEGPALQRALDALATAGGGTLFVPAGRYAIITPVQKNFAGLGFVGNNSGRCFVHACTATHCIWLRADSGS
ncbi:MAG: glycosyl hydrolase family 28-related protein [Pyrinomonadaceae bacterium]